MQKSPNTLNTSLVWQKFFCRELLRASKSLVLNFFSVRHLRETFRNLKSQKRKLPHLSHNLTSSHDFRAILEIVFFCASAIWACPLSLYTAVDFRPQPARGGSNHGKLPVQGPETKGAASLQRWLSSFEDSGSDDLELSFFSRSCLVVHATWSVNESETKNNHLYEFGRGPFAGETVRRSYYTSQLQPRCATCKPTTNFQPNLNSTNQNWTSKSSWKRKEHSSHRMACQAAPASSKLHSKAFCLQHRSI